MPLFRCSSCGCVENSALGNFWSAEPGQAACSECSDGTWHGRFEKKPAVGYLVDERGHLWAQVELDQGKIPPHVRIQGRLAADGTVVSIRPAA